MEGMFEGTGLTSLYLYQEPQAVLKNKMGNFDEADLHKAYAQDKGKDYETVTISSISRQIGRKPQAQTNTAPPPGFNIAPSEDPYITSVLTQKDSEDEDDSLLGGSYLALDKAGDNISLLGYKASLTGGDVNPPGDVYLGDSTSILHTSSSKVKQTSSLITQ